MHLEQAQEASALGSSDANDGCSASASASSVRGSTRASVAGRARGSPWPECARAISAPRTEAAQTPSSHSPSPASAPLESDEESPAVWRSGRLFARLCLGGSPRCPSTTACPESEAAILPCGAPCEAEAYEASRSEGRCSSRWPTSRASLASASRPVEGTSSLPNPTWNPEEW